jgi:inorganic pyrophosphatase
MAKPGKRSPYAKLPALDGRAGRINVVIETPRGCRNKYKFDDRLGVFRLSSVLPAGAVFPFDFGYVPGTKAEDGDPIDVLLLVDEPVFPGCIVRSRLIGVIEADQTENGKTERNDRLLAVACSSHDHDGITTIKDVDENLRHEVEHFFCSYNDEKGKRFEIRGMRGPRAAMKLLRKAMQ